MTLLLDLLTSGATLAIAVAPVARVDTLASAACHALAQAAYEQPSVAGDVHASLAVHGAVVRWDPAAGPIRLWVQPRVAPIVDWNRSPAAWTDAVLSAARSWRGIVPGLEFRAERDSTAADVVVTWVDERSLSGGASPGLSSGTAGRTELTAADGRATAARVRLALTSADGATYDVADVRAVARHELGHAIGLAHHAAAKSVMAARVQADRLHSGDAAALRVLYALPMGARCEGTRQLSTDVKAPSP